MLGYFNFSIIGLSHLEKEPKICQDANRVDRLENGWIVAAIADGVGSAAHAEIGAQLAVNTVIDTVSGLMSDFKIVWNPENLKKFLKAAYTKAMENITTQAQKEGNPIADYETTLTTVIYNGTDIVFGQSGDGGILVLYNSGDVESITTVQKGDAFNEVVPLRAGETSWIFGESLQPVAALLMMTDGIYDVACPPVLARTEQPVRINYVRQFMDRNLIQVENELDFIDLQNMVREFYENRETGSKKITDDKTMVGIINTDILPTIKEEAYYKAPNYSSIREEQLKKLYEKRDLPVREAEFTPHHNSFKKKLYPLTVHHQKKTNPDNQYEELEPLQEKQSETEVQVPSADKTEQNNAVVPDKIEELSPAVNDAVILDKNEPASTVSDTVVSEKKESSSDIIDAENTDARSKR